MPVEIWAFDSSTQDSQEIHRSPVFFLLVVNIPPTSLLHKPLPCQQGRQHQTGHTALLWLNTICFMCQRTIPLTASQHLSPEEHQWKWFMPLLNNTAHVPLTEAHGPIFGYENSVKVQWFNFILKWEHMENGALGDNAILLNRCSCQRKHLEGKQVWLMRWFTTVNLGHNSNAISISFWAISRRQKSN